MRFHMYVPTRILFGEGQLNHLHSQQMPGKKGTDCDFQWEVRTCKRVTGQNKG